MKVRGPLPFSKPPFFSPSIGYLPDDRLMLALANVKACREYAVKVQGSLPRLPLVLGAVP